MKNNVFKLCAIISFVLAGSSVLSAMNNKKNQGPVDPKVLQKFWNTAESVTSTSIQEIEYDKEKQIITNAIDLFNEEDRGKNKFYLDTHVQSRNKDIQEQNINGVDENEKKDWEKIGTFWFQQRDILKNTMSLALKDKLPSYSRFYTIISLLTGTFGLGCAALSFALLLHVIARIIVTTHTCKSVTSSRLVMGLVRMCGMDAQKFAEGIAKFEEKWGESKWIGNIQNNEASMNAVVYELLASLLCAFGAGFSLFITVFTAIPLYYFAAARKLLAGYPKKDEEKS